MPLLDKQKKMPSGIVTKPAPVSPQKKYSDLPSPAGPPLLQPTNKPTQPLGKQMPAPATGEPTSQSPSLTQTAVQPPNTIIPSKNTTERLGTILDQDSPLMRQAATQGRQYAQKRGLLNSSLGAQASQDAVIRQSLAIAESEGNSELANFYAGFERERFESDEAYRDKALATEKTLRERGLALNEELGRGGLDLDKQRLTLQEELGRGGLGIDQERLTLDKAQQEFYQNLDRERLNTDNEYRNSALEYQKFIDERRLDTQRDLSRDEMELRRELSQEDRELRRELSQEENSLREQQQAFYQDLDMQKFESDAEYREQALEQDRTFRQQTAENQLKKLDIDTQNMEQNQRNGLLAATNSANDILAREISSINANPDLSQQQRTAQTVAARQRRDDSIQLAATLYQEPIGNFEPQTPGPDPAPPTSQAPSLTPTDAQPGAQPVGQPPGTGAPPDRSTQDSDFLKRLLGRGY